MEKKSVHNDEIRIRNLDPKTKQQLIKLAKSKHMSLSAYLKMILENYTADIEVQAMDERYNKLVHDTITLFTELQMKTNRIIDENTYAIERLYGRGRDDD